MCNPALIIGNVEQRLKRDGVVAAFRDRACEIVALATTESAPAFGRGVG